MNKIKTLVQEYHSKKLKEIVEQQSASYNEKFIYYAKDELIRRGETFQFDSNLEKEVAAMNDNDLKNIVEEEWTNYHLEYLEIARKEYMRRNFKYESKEEEPQQGDENIYKKYPALKAVSGVYYVFAWLVAIAALIMVFAYWDKVGLFASLLVLFQGAFAFLSLLALAELVKVVMDIEINTRKEKD